MYQPKIKEELIPKLYRLAKARGVPMTPFVGMDVALCRYSQERSANGS